MHSHNFSIQTLLYFYQVGRYVLHMPLIYFTNKKWLYSSHFIEELLTIRGVYQLFWILYRGLMRYPLPFRPSISLFLWPSKLFALPLILPIAKRTEPVSMLPTSL